MARVGWQDSRAAPTGRAKAGSYTAVQHKLGQTSSHNYSVAEASLDVPSHICVVLLVAARRCLLPDAGVFSKIMPLLPHMSDISQLLSILAGALHHSCEETCHILSFRVDVSQPLAHRQDHCGPLQR